VIGCTVLVGSYLMTLYRMVKVKEMEAMSTVMLLKVAKFKY